MIDEEYKDEGQEEEEEDMFNADLDYPNCFQQIKSRPLLLLLLQLK